MDEAAQRRQAPADVLDDALDVLGPRGVGGENGDIGAPLQLCQRRRRLRRQAPAGEHQVTRSCLHQRRRDLQAHAAEAADDPVRRLRREGCASGAVFAGGVADQSRRQPPAAAQRHLVLAVARGDLAQQQLGLTLEPRRRQVDQPTPRLRLFERHAAAQPPQQALRRRGELAVGGLCAACHQP